MIPYSAAALLAAEHAAPEPEEKPSDLTARLQAYSRYVAVIAEGLEALQRRDVPRLQELAEERRKLERELAGAAEAGDASPAPPPSSAFQGLLEKGLRELANEAEMDEWERHRWEWLQDGALSAARGLALRPLQRGDYRGAGPAETQLDVRF